jgi:hypothetical protein
LLYSDKDNFRRVKMKKFRYIIPVILVAASSCTSQLFTGNAYDDLYYRESDQPVVAVQQNYGAVL